MGTNIKEPQEPAGGERTFPRPSQEDSEIA